MDLELSTDGLDDITALMEIAQDKVSDFSPLESSLRSIFYQNATLIFESSPPVESGGLVYGDVWWTPLKNPKKNRRGGKILIDSQTLERSVTVEGDDNNIFDINGTEAIFGSSLIYANRQNTDRPFLFWHPILLEQVAGAIADWIGDFSE